MIRRMGTIASILLFIFVTVIIGGATYTREFAEHVYQPWFEGYHIVIVPLVALWLAIYVAYELGRLHISVRAGDVLEPTDWMKEIAIPARKRDVLRPNPTGWYIETKTQHSEGKEVWAKLRPTGGDPYCYATQLEAERMMQMCYPEQVVNVHVRVVEVTT